MVKVICDMCGKEIDYNLDGVNIEFNHYGIVKMKGEYINEKYRNGNCLCIYMDYNSNSCNFCN